MKNHAAAMLLLSLGTLSAKAEVTLPVDRPDWVIGDAWTYQWKDLKEQKDTERHIARVESKSQDEYVVNVQVEGAAKPSYKEIRSLDLWVRRTVEGKDVLVRWIEFPLTPGRSWSDRNPWVNSSGHHGWDDITYTVEGVEKITVAAGTLEAIKVVGKGWWNNTDTRSSGTIELTYWYSPVAT